MKKFGQILVLLALAGCSVGSQYHRPAALPNTQDVPATFAGTDPASTNVTWKKAEPTAHLARGAWWEMFGDPVLNRLEALAATNNQEVAAGLARFDQARALVGVARSDYFPHLTVAPGYTRQRTSFNQPDSGQPAGFTHTFNNFSVPLDAQWEIDLWGRVRRQTEAAKARLQATADETEALKLTIQAEVSINYFTLRALEAEHRLLLKTIDAYRRSLELTRNRRAGGIATDLDVAQADTQVKSAEAQEAAVELQRIQTLHALATLCGQASSRFQVASEPSEPKAVEILSIPLPSELLERRPDVAAAERRMAAENAQIGVAQAAFYPQIRFHGLAGFQSISASTLFDWPSRFWAVGPSIELPLFTGGRNRAQLAAARAVYNETVANYRATVLRAFQEVEDQLASQRLLAVQLDAEVATMEAARRTLEIANNRYQAGLVTYLEVANAQSAALASERRVVELRAERASAAVALAKALGGGWQQVPPEQTISSN